MNQGKAEECRDSPIQPPWGWAAVGKRLSLTDLFCREQIALTTPDADPSTPHHQQQQQPAAVAAVVPVPEQRSSSPSNPYLAELLAEEAEWKQSYIHDQFQWKYGLQAKYRVVDYLSYYPVIVTPEMRFKLIGWLNKTTVDLSYDIETFLLAINFVDRFLAGKSSYLMTVERLQVLGPADRLQLLGSAALLVASKKEETRPLDVEDLVNLSENTYSAPLICDMEIWLLYTLDFHLCAPTAAYFFEYYMAVTAVTREPSTTKRVRELFHLLLKARLVHYELMHYAPSTVAAAALCLCQGSFPDQLAVWLVEAQELHDVERCFFGMTLWLQPQHQLAVPDGLVLDAHIPQQQAGRYFDASLWQQLQLHWPASLMPAQQPQFPPGFFNSNEVAAELYQQFANCSIAYPH